MKSVRRSGPAGANGDRRAGLGNAGRDPGSRDPGDLASSIFASSSTLPSMATTLIDFTPTFMGCPALEAMERAMQERIEQLGGEAEVRVVLDDSGRRTGSRPSVAPSSARPGSPARAPRGGAVTLVQLRSGPHRCPWCGSTDGLDSIFTPTPCRSLRLPTSADSRSSSSRRLATQSRIRCVADPTATLKASAAGADQRSRGSLSIHAHPKASAFARPAQSRYLRRRETPRVASRQTKAQSGPLVADLNAYP